MKKLLLIVVLALVIASVMLAATGCGDSKDNGSGENGTLINGAMDGDDNGVVDLTDYSVVGTFESDEGTYITLDADGTFETDAWGGMKEGAYEPTQDEEGYWWVELTFEDGSLAELSVIITMGEVAALFDDLTMTQYNKI